jgi:thiol-disulfide isomerase/thioredoxin
MKEILIGLFLAANLCLSANTKFFPKVQQRTTFKGKISNLKQYKNAPKEIELSVDDITVGDQHKYIVKIDNNGHFRFDIPLYSSINAYLKYGASRVTPYLFPNDSISIDITIGKRNGQFGIVDGQFDMKYDKFEKNFFKAYRWFQMQVNEFEKNLPQNVSANHLKAEWLDFEKKLVSKFEHLAKRQKLESFIVKYNKYTVKYFVYSKIIKLAKKLRSANERKSFLKFFTPKNVFDTSAIITSEYQYFLNSYQYDVEEIETTDLILSDSQKEDSRYHVTKHEVAQYLKYRNGDWAEFLAANRMYNSGLLAEELNLGNVENYRKFINENFKNSYVKQLLLSKCDLTENKIKEIQSKTLPLNSSLKIAEDVPGAIFFNQILDEYRGKKLYIDIWATWCGPCKRQLPKTVELSKIYPDIEFIYICTKSKKKAWENIIKDFQIEGRNYLINAEQYEYLRRRFKISGIPHSILIDSKGRVFFNDYPGFKIEEEIEQKLIDLTRKG